MQNCPNCQSIKSKIYILVKDWTIKECLNCHILYTNVHNKSVISNTNKDVYTSDYVKNYQFREQKLKKRFKRLLTKIELFKKGGYILDIGCSLGYFLQVAENSTSSWITEGVEPNKKLIKLASKNVKGVIILGMLPKLPVNTNKYDLVTCFDVLEHSFELKKNVDEIKRILKKDGLCVIQSPNYRSLMAYLCREKWDWWSPPDHLLHFSFFFVTDYLKNNGFEIVDANTYEPIGDFIWNIRGKINKTIISNILFLFCIPFLLLAEYIAWNFNHGALLFVIAKKK